MKRVFKYIDYRSDQLMWRWRVRVEEYVGGPQKMYDSGYAVTVLGAQWAAWRAARRARKAW